MRRTLSLSPIVAIAIVALLTIPLPALAGRSTGNCTGGTGITPIQVATGLPKFYVDDRGLTNGIWIYQETNFHANLQRGGTSILDEDDTCVDNPNLTPDTLIL